MENPFERVSVETPRNTEQKCLCVLCLDVSGSMTGKPIQALNEGLKVFAEEVKKDMVARQRLEVAIITFDSLVKTVQEPDLIDYFSMPELTAGGTTKLVDGVRAAIRKIEDRKKYYREHGINYYRPFIILMTDGQPDPDQDIQGLSEEIKHAVTNRKFTFWAIGVEEYNHQILQSICYPHPPKALNGLRFSEFFQWLSATLKMVSQSSQTQSFTPPPTDSWALDNLSSDSPTQSPI